MNAVTKIDLPLNGSAARAVREADQSAGKWLKDLVTGEGSSPAHIIVTGVLGVVPGVGQAMDARDIVIGVIALSASPANPMTWLTMLITLVGCIPAFGDAFKTVFLLVKRGDSLPRILDGLSTPLRGNVERWIKNIQWNDIAQSAKKTFDDAIGAFINGIDSWVIKAVGGRKEIDFLIAQLRDLQKRAPKMLDDAVKEMQTMWNKALKDELPKSTAANAVPRPRALPQAKKTQLREPQPIIKDRSDKNPVRTKAANTDERRATKTKKKWKSGVPAEHITDYHTAKARRNLKKANNAGKLWEEWHRAGRQGIDHVWMNKGEPVKPGIIGETKSSLFGAFQFMAALPADIRAQFSELGDAEAANPVGGHQPDKPDRKEQPDIFKSEGRDGLNPRAKVEGTKKNEAAIKRGVGNTKTKGVQMSHRWIMDSIGEENLTVAGKDLARMIDRWYKKASVDKTLKPPYARWIIMVTGRQKHLHESKGHQHEIQKPLIILPDNILEK